jgi:hypothetical protein
MDKKAVQKQPQKRPFTRKNRAWNSRFYPYFWMLVYDNSKTGEAGSKEIPYYQYIKCTHAPFKNRKKQFPAFFGPFLTVLKHVLCIYHTSLQKKSSWKKC